MLKNYDSTASSKKGTLTDLKSANNFSVVYPPLVQFTPLSQLFFKLSKGIKIVI